MTALFAYPTILVDITFFFTSGVNASCIYHLMRGNGNFGSCILNFPFAFGLIVYDSGIGHTLMSAVFVFATLSSVAWDDHGKAVNEVIFIVGIEVVAIIKRFAAYFSPAGLAFPSVGLAVTHIAVLVNIRSIA